MKTQDLNGTEMDFRILQLHDERCCLAWHVTKIKGIGQFGSWSVDLALLFVGIKCWLRKRGRIIMESTKTESA